MAEVVGAADAILLPLGAYPSGEGGSVFDATAYTPLMLEVIEVARGLQQPEILDLMVPGGTVGCASFLTAGVGELEVGRRYAFFVDASSLRLPSGESALVAYLVWPVSAGGLVKTPLDGDLSIHAFVSAVRSAAEQH
ncbi:MAG: hypothetical protein M3395_06355 [Chloroflexota bacterium]|nr:hypothetical protein [Chloroflexota bacterium]